VHPAVVETVNATAGLLSPAGIVIELPLLRLNVAKKSAVGCAPLEAVGTGDGAPGGRLRNDWNVTLPELVVPLWNVTEPLQAPTSGNVADVLSAGIGTVVGALDGSVVAHVTAALADDAEDGDGDGVGVVGAKLVLGVGDEVGPLVGVAVGAAVL
jgi:hypothetical protein